MDEAKKKKILREIIEWLALFACALALYLIIHFFVFEIAIVDGTSMLPTLSHNERVVVVKVPYLFGEPQRGDIVAFPYANDPSRFFVKRVIGVPGDVISADTEGIYVNGEFLDDAFAETPPITKGDADYPVYVPEGSFFVMGDNRSGSFDSRYSSVGVVSGDDFIGKVMLRFPNLRLIE